MWVEIGFWVEIRLWVVFDLDVGLVLVVFDQIWLCLIGSNFGFWLWVVLDWILAVYIHMGFVFDMDVGLVVVVLVQWWCWLILGCGFGGCGLKRGRRSR